MLDLADVLVKAKTLLSAYTIAVANYAKACVPIAPPCNKAELNSLAEVPAFFKLV